MLFSSIRGNADYATVNLLKYLGLNFNPDYVVEELEKHPDYPSLLAVSDVLNWFKLENAAYKVDAEKITQIPTPFIAQTTINDDFVTVSKIVKNIVTLHDQKRGTYHLKIEDFKSRYKGVVLTAELPDRNVRLAHQNFIDTIIQYKSFAAILMLGISFLLVLFYGSSYASTLNWNNFLLTCVKTIGLIVSVLLLIQSIDKNNPMIQTLCGGGEKANCNAILTSKAATVFKGLTWSEVGFFYFAGTWLVLLFGGGSILTLKCVAVLNLLSLPYTIYSLNYQFRIAKQICKLCCIVQTVLWLEFFTGFYIWKLLLNGTNLNQVGLILACLIFPIALWWFLEPLFSKSQQLIGYKKQLRRFKYNRELFDTSLKKRSKYAQPANECSIVLGNIESLYTITMVSGPYCQPCTKTHYILDQWLNYRNDLQLKIIFLTDSEEDKRTVVCRHLMALNNLPDKTVVARALHDWYGQRHKNYDSWAKAYPVQINNELDITLEKQREWCKITDVTETPSVLFNGYKLPDTYQLNDIKYMLD